jgi:hypothetical protein
MFDLVGKAKKFLSQSQPTNEFTLTPEEVDRILQEEINGKFAALEKQAAIEQAALHKEEERNALAKRLRDEAILRRQVLQNPNSSSQQIQNSINTISSKPSNDPQIVELQNLLKTLGEVRATSSHTEDKMAQLLASCDVKPPIKRLSIDEQMNQINTSVSNKIIKTPSLDELMNSLIDAETSKPMNKSIKSNSEIDELKKLMGF